MGGKVGPAARTRSLLTSAEAFRAAEQYMEAIAELERALDDEGAHDPALRAEILLRLADCHTGLNHHEETCRTLVPLLEQAPSPIWEARAMIRAGRALFYRHDLESAETLCREAALAVAPTIHHDDLAFAYQWLGNALQAQGKIEGAAEAFRDAIAAAARSEDRARYGSCLGSLGCLDTARSRYLDAVRSLERCRDEVSGLGLRLEEARANLHVSVCWMYLGDWKQTERTLDEALRIYSRMGNDSGEALALIGRCRLEMRRERREHARAALDRARSLTRRAEYERLAMQVLIQEGDLRSNRGELEEAAPAYDEAGAGLLDVAPGGDLAYSATRRFAYVTSRLGDHVHARTLVAEARAGAVAASNRREAAHCRLTEAQIEWRLGALERATMLVEKAIQEFRAIRTPWELARAHEAAADIHRTDPMRERFHLNEAIRLRGRLGLDVDRLEKRLRRESSSVCAADQVVATGPPMSHTLETARGLWRFDGCV
ncbi:MAG TPA: hypothetical protein VKU85_06760, partial [bacterium]|nr:hypothetical protein [bacterium]